MKRCICEGNAVLRDIEHMRALAKKAASLEDKVFVLFENDGVYNYTAEDEFAPYKGNLKEIIYP